MERAIRPCRACPFRLEKSSVADWRNKASCRQLAVPVNFFPEPTDAEAVEAAKAVCSSCPVRQACRELGSSFTDSVGVWGGELFELPEEESNEPYNID